MGALPPPPTYSGQEPALGRRAADGGFAGLGGRAPKTCGSDGQARYGRGRLRLTNGSRTGKNGARHERVGVRQVRLTDAAECWRSDLQVCPAGCGLVSADPAIEESAGRCP